MKLGNKKQVQCDQVDMNDMHESNLIKHSTTMATMIKT